MDVACTTYRANTNRKGEGVGTPVGSNLAVPGKLGRIFLAILSESEGVTRLRAHVYPIRQESRPVIFVLTLLPNAWSDADEGDRLTVHILSLADSHITLVWILSAAFILGT